MGFWKRKPKIYPPSSQPPPRVFIPESVLTSSTSLLQATERRRHEHEGVLYWAGKSFGEDWIISTCIAPQAQTTRGSFDTSAQSNAEVIAYLASHQLELLAQVHSHPGPWVDHSEGDNEGALMPYTHFLSIVVPYYGRSGILPLLQCGIHRFENGRFRRLTNNEVRVTFSILPSVKNFRQTI